MTTTTRTYLSLVLALLLGVLLASATPLLAHDDGTEHEHETGNSGKPRPAFPFIKGKPGESGMQMRFREATSTQWKPVPPPRPFGSSSDMRWKERGPHGSTTEWMPGRKDEFKERLGDRRGQFMTQARERIHNYTAHVVERLSALIERLYKIADRIESRADKIAENGTDVSEAKEALSEARADLGEASDMVDDLKSSFGSILTASSTASTTFQGVFGELRTELAAIKGVFKSVHGHLRDAVSSLKGKGGGDEASDSATTTP
jgi:hypothetical protein